MINAITYILNNDATLISLLGNNKADTKTKVYPVIAPETEKAPYCSCRVASKTRLAKNCSFNFSIEINVFATSYDDLYDISEAIIDILESTASGTYNGDAFASATFTNEYDNFSKDHDLYYKTLTFDVHGL